MVALAIRAASLLISGGELVSRATRRPVENTGRSAAGGDVISKGRSRRHAMVKRALALSSFLDRARAFLPPSFEGCRERCTPLREDVSICETTREWYARS